MRISACLHEAIRDLVRADLHHKAASEAFLAAQPDGDPDGKLASELEKANLAVADAGTEVACIATTEGIEPSEEDDPMDDFNYVGSPHHY